MNEVIRIGTRRSKLALWQAYHVESLLNQHGLKTEIAEIDTTGDKILDVSIAKIGSKGVFTEELENALREGSIDIAVHSAKDMPSTLPEGFEIIAFTEREAVHDVLISPGRNISLGSPDLHLIGTSSTRRIAFLKYYFPAIETVSIRGNLQTRIRKMEEGQCDALMLAYAGVHRMGYDSMIQENLDINQFIPPVGQGSVAIESYQKLSNFKKDAIGNAVNHIPTWLLLTAERAFLKTLEGGCSIPSFCMAEYNHEKEIIITGGLISLDGKNMVKKELIGNIENAEILGKELAESVLGSGGDKILLEIKSQLH
ncbi:hydroxymethylbilane synthase [Bacteroidota bacterium]